MRISPKVKIYRSHFVDRRFQWGKIVHIVLEVKLAWNKNTVTLHYLSADIVSTVEFNHDGELLATGDKGGRIVIFQKEDAVSFENINGCWSSSFSVSWWPIVRHCFYLFVYFFYLVAERITALWRIQCLQHFSKSRTRVRLPKEFGDRGKNQQDQVVKTSKCIALFAVNER